MGWRETGGASPVVRPSWTSERESRWENARENSEEHGG